MRSDKLVLNTKIPEGRLHTYITSEPLPPFEEAGELETNWGRKWGAADEVSQLRVLLMRRPNAGLADVRADAWDENFQALVDPDKNWYWLSQTPPDMTKVNAQHDAFVATLRHHGVEVVFAPDLPPTFTKSMYARDPLLTVPGGAVITRLAPRMRRGEARSITQTVARAGMPILGTITGGGTVEGGSFVKLRPDLAAYGTSVRCNREGFDQLSRIVGDAGVDLIDVKLTGYRIHLDGALFMLDHDLALVNLRFLPYEFIEKLHALGIETVEPHPDEEWAINSLALGPRRVVMAEHLVRTAASLNAVHGVDIVPVAYDEIGLNGGGLHCSTMELVRDW